jgi:hypothetical protein
MIDLYIRLGCTFAIGLLGDSLFPSFYGSHSRAMEVSDLVGGTV